MKISEGTYTPEQSLFANEEGVPDRQGTRPVIYDPSEDHLMVGQHGVHHVDVMNEFAYMNEGDDPYDFTSDAKSFEGSDPNSPTRFYEYGLIEPNSVGEMGLRTWGSWHKKFPHVQEEMANQGFITNNASETGYHFGAATVEGEAHPQKEFTIVDPDFGSQPYKPWQPGQRGKGYVDLKGNVWAWDSSDIYAPHHPNIAELTDPEHYGTDEGDFTLENRSFVIRNDQVERSIWGQPNPEVHDLIHQQLPGLKQNQAEEPQWHFGNTLQWRPGTWGKAIAINGEVHAWTTGTESLISGNPHHNQVAEQLGVDYETFMDDLRDKKIILLQINPDGNMSDCLTGAVIPDWVVEKAAPLGLKVGPVRAWRFAAEEPEPPRFVTWPKDLLRETSDFGPSWMATHRIPFAYYEWTNEVHFGPKGAFHDQFVEDGHTGVGAVMMPNWGPQGDNDAVVSTFYGVPPHVKKAIEEYHEIGSSNQAMWSFGSTRVPPIADYEYQLETMGAKEGEKAWQAVNTGWKPKKNGKMLVNDGQLYTWATDDEGFPNHSHVIDILEAANVSLDPEVMDQVGIINEDGTYKSYHKAIDEAVPNQDPRLKPDGEGWRFGGFWTDQRQQDFPEDDDYDPDAKLVPWTKENILPLVQRGYTGKGYRGEGKALEFEDGSVVEWDVQDQNGGPHHQEVEQAIGRESSNQILIDAHGGRTSWDDINTQMENFDGMMMFGNWEDEEEDDEFDEDSYLEQEGYTKPTPIEPLVNHITHDKYYHGEHYEPDEDDPEPEGPQHERPVIFDGSQFHVGQPNAYHWDMIEHPDMNNKFHDHLDRGPRGEPKPLIDSLAMGRYNPVANTISWAIPGKFHPEPFKNLVQQAFPNVHDESAELGFENQNWHFGSVDEDDHVLNWEEGNSGKGMLFRDGTLHTWNTEDYYVHAEYMADHPELDEIGAQFLYIDKDGKITTTWGGLSPVHEERIKEADPRLYVDIDEGSGTPWQFG